VVGLSRLGNLPIGFLRLRLEQLIDQLALLLRREVPTMQIKTQHVRPRVAFGQHRVQRGMQLAVNKQTVAVYAPQSVKAIDAVEQLWLLVCLLPQHHRLSQSVRENVVLELC
jgi:hypothetical protein